MFQVSSVNSPLSLLISSLSTFLTKYATKLFIVSIFLGSTLSLQPAISAEFTGSKTCINCHQQAYKDWQGSHHDMSMKHADKTSVLGDFNNASLPSSNKELTKTSRFFKKGEQFWVNIQGEDGKFHDYQIKYTFGYTPLQQYMVEFDDGRVQLIPFAWDSRSKADGGQRWFNLYPDMTKKYQEFFWTNTGQNWNYMCADCHSTNVEKNFDLKTNTYNTTYSEVNVACESCHGPASDHITWAGKNIKSSSDELNQQSNKGFIRNLAKSVSNWKMNANKKTLAPESIDHSSQQVLVCAQCHSRRTQISNNDHVKDNAFGERYLLDLISNENYHADGQVYNENFVYGSFLQSKMYKNGVVCSDCHNPHTAELKMPVETLCLQCHQADNYATQKHHKHQKTPATVQCVDCHMPKTTYMKIDARRDHGFHIPTPNLAKKLGTPDTCLTCHEDKDSNWSANKVNAWYPHSVVEDEKDFAPIFAAMNLTLTEPQLLGTTGELSRIAQNKAYSNIIRASALTKMANTSNTNTIIAIARAAKDPDEYIRLGAIDGAQSMASSERWRILSPLLKDEVLIVRTSAAYSLVTLWDHLSIEQKNQLMPALNEYMTSQRYNSDRSFAHSNMGIVFAYQGDFVEAEKAFKAGIAIEPSVAQTYLNLSQLYHQMGENNKSIDALLQGQQANPSYAGLAYALGLAYIRAKNYQNAANALAKATILEPQNSHYFYVYGLSLEKIRPNDAYKALYKSYQLSNNPQSLYALCEMQIRHQSSLANQCLEQLQPIVPPNVIQQLRQMMNNTKKN
ncbi:ammonia-forming cytochrome c nitrite reductase subunit c552 [Colwellia sp. E2M01]|uniref:multiheme c-type cytochrome n=1 Tax=Colwellia sp. E2M01 TaxID=2841561 RepID=UPI001C091BD9|nr:ammonia-forming cytochrome c nitrite reductase subunit c552 [Colwellia sp. E2M01]MBU2870915.1 deca-heme c-type cytochrome [Colwellia sp. E2M01]